MQYWRSKSPTNTATNGIPPPPAYSSDDDDGIIMAAASAEININPDEQIAGVGGGGAIDVAAVTTNESEILQVQIENRHNDLTTTTTITTVAAATSQNVNGSSKCDVLPAAAAGVVADTIVTINTGMVAGRLHENVVENNELTSVICTVGLPATKTSLGKRKLDADYNVVAVATSIGGTMALAGTSSSMNCESGGASGSDIKKARRVQNKARCQNVINGSSNSSSSSYISNSSNSNVGIGKNTRSK